MIPLFLLHFLSFFPHMPAAYYTTMFRRHLALLERAMTSFGLVLEGMGDLASHVWVVG